MIEDGYGHGRVVFYAATTEEDTLHLRKLLQCFKENNPKFSSIQVVIIDKDFAEWKMLKEELPNAVVLFCQWHVIKAMFKQLTDCGVEKFKRDDARNAIRCLVHTKNQDDYEVKKKELFDATNDVFKAYFLSNWETCIEMWAMFKRDDYLHYGNTTNNRLESHNQKLKDVTSRTSTLSEMFENVVLLAENSEAEYKHSSFTEEFTTAKSTIHHDIGEHFSEIGAICTQYASNIIAEQMKLALTVKYEVLQREEMIEVKSPNESMYVVKLSCDADGTVCSCSFFKTMRLPCRHIFAARHFSQLPLFQACMVPQRWFKQYQLCVDENPCKVVGPCDENHDIHISTFTGKALATTTLSQGQKFKKMLSLCHKLATVASQSGMPEFRKKYDDVENILRCWEQNVSVVITATSDLTLKVTSDMSHMHGSSTSDGNDDSNHQSVIDANHTCDDDFKHGQTSTLPDHDVDLQSSLVDMNTKPGYVDVDTQPMTGHVDTQTGCDDTKPGHLGADAEPNYYDAVNTQLSHIGTDTQPVLDDTKSGHVDAGLQPDYDVNTLFGHGDADIQPGCDDTKPGHVNVDSKPIQEESSDISINSKPNDVIHIDEDFQPGGADDFKTGHVDGDINDFNNKACLYVCTYACSQLANYV